MLLLDQRALDTIINIFGTGKELLGPGTVGPPAGSSGWLWLHPW